MGAIGRIGGWHVAAGLFALLVTVLLFALGFGATSRRDAIAVAREQAARRAALEASALTADVEKFRVLPFVLVQLPDVTAVFANGSQEAVMRLDGALRELTAQTGATVFYAIDRDGRALAASNAGSDDSFVGHDFRFRPYFVEALQDGQSEYFAEGSVTRRPGLFLARRAGTASAPRGVVVVKIEFDRIERLWRSAAQTALVVDRHGVIVIGTDPARRFQTIAPMSPARRAEIARSRQFGAAGLTDAGLRFADGVATDAAGQRYIAVARRLPVLGWRHIHLEPLRPVLAAADARTRTATLVLALLLAAVGGLTLWSATRRRRIETARALLETEVARRTAELTDAYERLQREGEERALADSRYRAAREELAQANRLGSIGTITTSVAHELNQPLAAIRTASENGLKLLARGRIGDAQGNLALVVTLTERIGAITGQLLSYGRRGRGERRPVRVDDILDGALMLVGDNFRRTGVALEVSRVPELPTLRASRIRIEQVLVNLLQNALDAVADRRDPRVWLSAEATADGVRLIVADNGPGIAPDQSETIFQPFHTGKPGGTGLGLGISQEIVQDHAGTLTLDTARAVGAAFVVDLPGDGGGRA